MESLPSKMTRRANDEISLESDSDSASASHGPSLPPGKSKTPTPVKQPPIGPSLPPQTHNEDEIALNDSDEGDDIGPPPPQGQQQRSMGPPLPPPEAKRVLGPAAPPAADLSQRPISPNDSDSESDSDYGPALPTTAEAERASRGRPADPSIGPEAPAGPLRRDDWMIVPPPAGGQRPTDPTKLRARKFASGPASSASARGEIGSMWTETAEEKRKRLADAVLGRGPDPTVASGPVATASRDKAAEERDAKIRANAEATRGKSLYEEHQAVIRKGRATGASGPVEEEDDPSKRAFDREKDMGLGSKITNSQRQQLLKRAANFGGRFQKGGYL